DKRTYHSGDVAHVLVTTPYPNMLALVSIERGHILQYQVRRLTGTATVLDIPVPSSYLPDTYVSVVVERGAAAGGPPPAWRLGYARIHVDTAERTLRIKVTPAKSRIGPGQTLPLNIHAVDYRGRAVQAQFSLSMVDAANLALTGDSGAGSDLLGTFYGYRELGVVTGNTLNINPEQQVTKRYIPIGQSQSRNSVGMSSNGVATPMDPRAPAAADHAAKSDNFAAKGANNQPITVRKNFADTAYWNAAVVTDAQGNATLSVSLPDNVTTWKVLGQAVTTDTLVGAGISSVMATKDMLLRPIAPRFFSLGDHAQVGATINNTTGTAMTVQLRLLMANGDPNKSPTVIGVQTVHLGANGEQNVTWPVRITALGTATIQVQAIDLQHQATNDAVQVAVPVQENSTPEHVATAGEAGANTHELVRIPSGIEPNEGSLSVTLEPTLASGLRAGADFLDQYPYASSIDLASQILGEAELGRLPARASVLTAAERSNLRPDIVHRLDRLYLLQRGDGGFGWWIDDTHSSPYITVYVLQALTTARDLGYPVNATVLSNAASYLLNNTQSPANTNAGANYDANLQAEIVYALTRYGQGSAVANLADQLFGARYLLAHYAKAYLMAALATHHTGKDDAHVQTLLADLTSAARLSAASTHWDEASYDWAALNSDISTTAIVLDVLNTMQPHSPLVAGAVRWLMAARKVNAWESTNATAVALRGLVDYVFSSGELNANYHYTVHLNSSLWGSGKVDATNLAQTTTLTQTLGPAAPAGSKQAVVIGRDVRPGNGKLTYVIRLQYFRPVDRINPVSQGVGVTRKYLTADGKSASLGSTIRVQLRITAPQDLFYLTLQDPLPAGAEAVDSSLQTTSQLAQINNTSKIPPGTQNLSWYVTHTDLRDNRTVLFVGFLPAGTYQYTYLIHLTTQGVFHTLPTHIEQSYFPEVFGRSNGSYFKVR
ncbi:MAG: alpha-2-macroglobulin domain protein, partial [Chloroflexi bacterium]|nr:alpha-2-macroglobulin domain protein [Chloroflexota bacterium]